MYPTAAASSRTFLPSLILKLFQTFKHENCDNYAFNVYISVSLLQIRNTISQDHLLHEFLRKSALFRRLYTQE